MATKEIESMLGAIAPLLPLASLCLPWSILHDLVNRAVPPSEVLPWVWLIEVQWYREE